MFPVPKGSVGNFLKKSSEYLKPSVVVRVRISPSVWLLCRNFRAGLWPSQGFLRGDHEDFSMTHTFTLQQKSHLFNQKEYDMVLYVLFYRVIIDIGRFKTIRCFMPKILIMELEISYLSVMYSSVEVLWFQDKEWQIYCSTYKVWPKVNLNLWSGLTAPTLSCLQSVISFFFHFLIYLLRRGRV